MILRTINNNAFFPAWISHAAINRLTDWRRLLQREDPASGDISLEETAGDHYSSDRVGSRLDSGYAAVITPIFKGR